MTDTNKPGGSCRPACSSKLQNQDLVRDDRYFALHRREEVSILGRQAAHHLEVFVRHLLRDRARHVANAASIDLGDRRDLHAGAAEKGFVGDVKLRPVDLARFNPNPETMGDLGDKKRGLPYVKNLARSFPKNPDVVIASQAFRK